MCELLSSKLQLESLLLQLWCPSAKTCVLLQPWYHSAECGHWQKRFLFKKWILPCVAGAFHSSNFMKSTTGARKAWNRGILFLLVADKWFYQSFNLNLELIAKRIVLIPLTRILITFLEFWTSIVYDILKFKKPWCQFIIKVLGLYTIFYSKVNEFDTKICFWHV